MRQTSCGRQGHPSHRVVENPPHRFDQVQAASSATRGGVTCSVSLLGHEQDRYCSDRDLATVHIATGYPENCVRRCSRRCVWGCVSLRLFGGDVRGGVAVGKTPLATDQLSPAFHHGLMRLCNGYALMVGFLSPNVASSRYSHTKRASSRLCQGWLRCCALLVPNQLPLIA
jgi:hypothetical protein